MPELSFPNHVGDLDALQGRSRRLAKDYERHVQTSETMIDIATVRMMINKLAPN